MSDTLFLKCCPLNVTRTFKFPEFDLNYSFFTLDWVEGKKEEAGKVKSTFVDDKLFQGLHLAHDSN